MPITILVLFVLSLAPIRFIGWTNWFSDQIRVTIAPIAHPLTIAANTIIPPPISNPEASQRERDLASELDLVRTQLLQTREENIQLNTLINQFSRGAEITPNLDVKQIHRPLISTFGDQLLIKTDKVDNLTQGTIVVVDAVQLLGKVSRVSGRTASILPITSKSAQPILATILLNKSGSEQAKCLLTPVGDGTLRGEVARSAIDESWTVQVGQEVRLLDNQWPQHAQMLMIGTVESLDRNEAQPLRQRVIVRPTVKDLRRVPEVILRLPVDDADNPIGATP
tara:strand:- start:2634 stop:3476 length:843 start_codon:yes stop_codon:yes gene_type:complete